ncbi:MAG: hypothetical protein N2441_09580 [Rhodocyclaceae bacterium]|nr:hypothetical protein [Rhodocyclaceae bacterium]
MATNEDAFFCPIPEGLLYDPEYDMWVALENEEVIIGATPYGVHLAGEVIGFTAKPRGAEVMRGRSLGVIECAKTILAVHAPVSFRLQQGNEFLEENPRALNRDPYAAWMVRGRPLNWEGERARLVDSSTYRAHVLRHAPHAEIPL